MKNEGQVLIVEDNKANLEYFKGALLKEGYIVRTATTAVEAIAEWEKEPADVFLTDLVLPDMHGRDLAACILSMTPDVEIIMATGKPSAENTPGELAGHIFTYLIKPVPLEHLKIAVSRAFERMLMLREREDLLEKFKTQVSELEETRRLKKRYLSFIVHELKRPLQALCGASDVLQAEQWDNDEIFTMIRIISRNSRVMVEMINNILNVEKMKYLTEIEDFTEIVVLPLIDTICKDFATIISNKDLDLVIDVPGNLTITADTEKIKAILSNLISNAVKFTATGVVTVSARKAGETVHFSIADTGCGISVEVQELVRHTLNSFNPSGYTVQGTGLGLPFVRDFVNLHGGKIWFESTSGMGTTFHLTLPLKYYTVEQKENTAYLHFLGARLVSQSRELKNVVSLLLENGIKKLLIDLSNVTFVDSVDISLLFGFYQTLRHGNGTLTLNHVSWQVLEILRLTQLDQLIEVIPGPPGDRSEIK